MAQWTYSRNVQFINEICTVGFLNIDFVRCFVSLDVVRITSANGRAISINLHLHPDTLVHFCARAASLLNEEHAWDWIEMTLIEEIRSAEETHHCLNAWVHHLRCPPSRRDSFVWRLVTSASSVTVADLHHAYAQAVDPHQGMGISPYPFWQSDLRQMLAEKGEEFFHRKMRLQHPSHRTFLRETVCS